MNINLELPPHVERTYLAEAKARGLALDAVILEFLVDAAREDDAQKGAMTVFEQGLGLFGSGEDAALLDEVVSIAYQERRAKPAPPP